MVWLFLSAPHEGSPWILQYLLGCRTLLRPGIKVLVGRVWSGGGVVKGRRGDESEGAEGNRDKERGGM